ncbi:MAG: RNA methyltransferase [Planctomycetes bacterium]|nr:RNA methyltransferase [Planctomycetota bacterium]MDP6424040.1 class I SAM-dependent RNA methyltransferase [Planctomycetota bacterium]
MKPFELFCACLPGIEYMLAAEMTNLGLGTVTPEPGGVTFAGHKNAIYRANLELGLCSHVLLRLGRFHARGLPHLLRKTATLPWENFLKPGEPVAIRVMCRKSKLYHSGAVEQRVRLGIFERLHDMPPMPKKDGQATVHVRIVDDECTLSYDTTGTPLWRRGWKEDVRKAPLREDLARALILASGWDRKSPLIDPLTGSGTVVIEAATMARQLAPGRKRSFLFETSPLLDTKRWQQVRDAATERELTTASPIFGSDRDAGAIKAAGANAERAGVAGDIEFACTSLSESPGLCGTPAVGELGFVVTNPPYGHRIPDKDGLISLYQKLGHMVGELPGRWTLALLSTNRRLAHKVGMPMQREFLTDHGGLKVNAFRYAPTA